MRGLSIFVFVSLAVTQVLGGNTYDEKEETVKAVQEKLKEFNTISESLLKTISSEKSKRPSEGETEAKNAGEVQKKQADESFDKQVLATTKTAIAKGKLLESIDCIQRTELEGKKLINETNKTFIHTVQDVWPNKLSILDFNEKEVKLIKTATEELINESIKKINNAKNGFQTLKNDAFTKTETAKGRLQNIETRITKLNLSEVFTTLKVTIESKYKEVMDNLTKKLQKCVS